MIANENPIIADSLWTATANPTPDCPPLAGAVQTDVVIVGGGFTGLSAALHLAEAGKSVVVLEAETPGWGASGRNGGQVNPGLKEGPDEIEARFGTDMGARMARMSGAAGKLVFELIEKHQIDCDPMPVGWIRAATSDSTEAELHDLAAQWQRRGEAVEPLDSAQVREMIGTNVYRGGLIDRRGGNVHPLNYALGLADAALKAGAQIHGHSRATKAEKIEGGHRIHTAGGSVEAGHVLLCTNGYTDDLFPPLRQTVVPVRSVQVATAPLSENIAGSILPGRQAPSDMRKLLLYFRKDAQGRFIMGGRGAYGDNSTRKQLDAMRAVSVEMFPQLASADWTHAWGGFVAVTPDHFPHLHELAPGVMAALGYNGRGVAMATAMGRLLSDWVMGRPQDDLDFPVTSARPMPFHRFHRLGVAVRVLQAELQDNLTR
ncbi:MAG: FAD-binding oxidoreductase [Marinibacterium sp.]|nr:FAD-binding oxidoreductase [Marinibacterium sp.]